MGQIAWVLISVMKPLLDINYCLGIENKNSYEDDIEPRNGPYIKGSKILK